MPSLIYNSAPDDTARGKINFESDTFRVMLTTQAYAEDKDAHTKRSDVTNEVVGTGYTAGGALVVPTVTKDLATDRVNVVFPDVTWPASTIVARKAVYYKARGGVATADELVLVVDYGANVSSTAADFIAGASTLRIENT